MGDRSCLNSQDPVFLACAGVTVRAWGHVGHGLVFVVFGRKPQEECSVMCSMALAAACRRQGVVVRKPQWYCVYPPENEGLIKG